jgi:hypothetical protein
MKILTFILTVLPALIYSQFSGIFHGIVNNDPIVLDLQQNGDAITGQMKDSKQTYIIDAKAIGHSFTGKAKEKSLGLTFHLKGDLTNNDLQLKADLDVFGLKSPAFNTLFTKQKNSNPAVKNKGTAQAKSEVIENDNIENSSVSVNNPKAPSSLNGKSIDRELIGQWKQESHYNSGYGSDFSGSTYSYMSFNANHTMSDGGSQANISGSNYSGQSSDRTTKIIPNVWYYTLGNKIIAVVSNAGKVTEGEMGTYFIKDGKMLFTQAKTNKKLLYYKM